MRTASGHSAWACSAACLTSLFLFSAGSAAETEGEKDVAEERLEFMLHAVRDLKAIPDDEPMAPWPLYAKPLLRWSNPVAGIRDGVVVMWTDGARPAVLAQVFPTKDNIWLAECQSLAPGPFMMRGDRVLWEPRQPGEGFQRLDDADPPAESRAKRLIQMRALAQQFTAFDDFRIHDYDKEATRHALRLMTNPVYRYEMPERQVVDGAVFSYVLGTDPEVFLVLEARQNKDGSRRWEYLLAPMTCWAIEVKRRDQTVWKVAERIEKQHDPRDTYYLWRLDESFDR